MNDKNIIQLCPICETGKMDYLLDKHSVFCSYIGCLNNGECSKFLPVTKLSVMTNSIKSHIKKT